MIFDTYLVFGGSGFIGTHLINSLNNNGSDIINFDLVDNERAEYEYIQGDVRENIDIEVKSDDSIIFNLAAVHVTPGHEYEEYFDTNIRGAKNVCNFARKNEIETIVFTSSIAPYGASEKQKTENTLPLPNTAYGISKLTAEYIHKVWQAEDPDNRKLIILRPGVVFGKYEGGNFTRLYEGISKKMFAYPGRKDTRKAGIYVKDLVNKMLEMVENEPPGVHLYNMCYPQPHTIEKIVETMADVIDVNAPSFKIPPLILKSSALVLQGLSSVTGQNFMGIHPDRIMKLMISTNISGQKLKNAGYELEYTLKEALADWYADSGGELY